MSNWSLENNPDYEGYKHKDGVITINVMNPKSVDAAIKEIQGRKLWLERRSKSVMEQLVKRGREIAEAKCDQYLNGSGTGDLKKSIEVKSSFKNGRFRAWITLDTPYAAFVEFGTGIEGQENPHPNAARRGWDYDVHGYGEEGWFYPYDDSRRHKWKVNPETGKLQPWTAGEPAKPIMYETLQELKAEIPKIMREVFSR